MSFYRDLLSNLFTGLKQKLIIFVIYAAPLFFLIKPWTRFGLFFIGGLIGLGLLMADEKYLCRYYNDVDQGEKKEADQSKKSENLLQYKFLATRSTLFLLAFVPLSFFVVTSTGSSIGVGLVAGMFIGLLQEMWQLKNQAQLFNQQFWSQVKTKLTSEQIRLVLIIGISYFLFLNLFFLR